MAGKPQRKNERERRQPFGVINRRMEEYGGEGEIRTPDTLSGTLAFEASAFNHSATSPNLLETTRMTIINERQAGGYFPRSNPKRRGNAKYLPIVNPHGR